MATKKQGIPQGRNRIAVLLRVLGWVCLALLVALVGALAWHWPRISKDAIAGASFGARVACSCHYIEGRPLDQCRADFEPGMALVMLSDDSATKSVTARFPLLATQTATFRPGEGCVLEKWAR